jgi:hypothetical protein
MAILRNPDGDSATLVLLCGANVMPRFKEDGIPSNQACLHARTPCRIPRGVPLT